MPSSRLASACVLSMLAASPVLAGDCTQEIVDSTQFNNTASVEAARCRCRVSGAAASYCGFASSKPGTKESCFFHQGVYNGYREETIKFVRGPDDGSRSFPPEGWADRNSASLWYWGPIGGQAEWEIRGVPASTINKHVSDAVSALEALLKLNKDFVKECRAAKDKEVNGWFTDRNFVEVWMTQNVENASTGPLKDEEGIDKALKHAREFQRRPR